MSDIVDIFCRNKVLTLSFELNIDQWESMDEEVKDIVSGEWENIKFLNDEGNALNEAVATVPDDVGGIYIFVLRPDLIPGLHLYIMYIAMMREIWGKELYFYYLPIKDDLLIEKVERELNRVIKAPCNTQYPDEYIRVLPSQKAFN